MCFYEVFEHQNCAFLDDTQHNQPLFIHAERFKDYANYQYDVLWANQNPGHVPCESVLRGDFDAAYCRQYRGLPLIHHVPLVQDCPLCNRSYRENDHIITLRGNEIQTIIPDLTVPHVYQNRYVGKCWRCAKEGNLPILQPPRNRWTGVGPHGDGSDGKGRPTEPVTNATGPPGRENYKGWGWNKIWFFSCDCCDKQDFEGWWFS